MKFKIYNSSDRGGRKTLRLNQIEKLKEQFKIEDIDGLGHYEIEVETLEDLLAIRNMIGWPLLVYEEKIEIFEGYRG